MHNLELRICNWILVGASMFLSGYYGYSLMLGEMPFAAIMFAVLKESGFSPDKNELCRICDVSAPTLGKIETIVRNLRNT